jgi:hypothetical protein
MPVELKLPNDVIRPLPPVEPYSDNGYQARLDRGGPGDVGMDG